VKAAAPRRRFYPGVGAATSRRFYPGAAGAAPVYESLFTTQVPTVTDAADGTPITVGTLLTFAVAGSVAGVRWYVPASAPSVTPRGLLYRWDSEPTGTLLAGSDFAGVTWGAGWHQTLFGTPVAVDTSHKYLPAVWTDRYTATSFLLQADLVNGNITGLVDSADHANGRYVEPSPVPAYPTNSFHATAYFVDVLFAAS
jgi:hypothetical protein